MMIKKPKFKSYFHVEILEPDAVFLLSERNHFVLRGQLYCLLSPFLDGHHTVDEIIDLLQKQASIAKIYYALMLMEKKGYIVEADGPVPPSDAAFWNFLDTDTKVAAKKLAETSISVTSFGDVPADQCITTLQSLGIKVCPDGDLGVILTDDYLQPGLDDYNRKSLASQRPWILVKPVGAVIWIGPLFSPGKTGCWECLAERLRRNREVETYIQQQKKDTPGTFPTSLSGLPSTKQTALNMAATEIAKWIVLGENNQLEGRLITLDTLDLRMQTHTLVRRPQCPRCADKKYLHGRKPTPLVLKSRKNFFVTDGGYRCCSPAESIKKLERHFSPITGIVNALVPMCNETQKDLIHVYYAGHGFARNYTKLNFLLDSLRTKSSGKGMTDVQAKLSGFCEAVERYSGVLQGDESIKKASYQELGKLAIHPNACMNFSKLQYEKRKERNTRAVRYHTIPEPFDETKKIEWTPVWSLTHNEFKYLPAAYCYYVYPRTDKFFYLANSNGNASGSTIEEAILQGFMELVERDCVAIWWYNRLPRPAAAIDSFNVPYFTALKEYYRTIHRDFWVLDITNDLNIPAFTAVSRRTDKKVEDIIYGFGAHFDPLIAIKRALTEMNQSLPSVMNIGTDGSGKYSYFNKVGINWWKTATVKNQPYLVPGKNAAPKVSSDYTCFRSGDLKEEVLNCVRIAEQSGLETLVLDQTRPDIEMNAVKVIVPGLRHFWARFGPGRLYDVPVKLGWRKEPCKEEELNPVPIFF